MRAGTAILDIAKGLRPPRAISTDGYGENCLAILGNTGDELAIGSGTSGDTDAQSVERLQIGAWSMEVVEDTDPGKRVTIALSCKLGSSLPPCVMAGLSFIVPPATCPACPVVEVATVRFLPVPISHLKEHHS